MRSELESLSNLNDRSLHESISSARTVAGCFRFLAFTPVRRLATTVAHAGICRVERYEAFAPPGSAT
jgi:hypothetical protein